MDKLDDILKSYFPEEASFNEAYNRKIPKFKPVKNPDDLIMRYIA
jgi:hypothetical protein